MIAAAVQMQPKIGDIGYNLARARRFAEEAAAGGAELIVLPEFFSTGMAFDRSLERAALPADGAATALLVAVAADHSALVGGSFICRLPDGSARNRFVLAGPHGVVGHHDKDLPTMWENCYYAPGADDGVIAAGDLSIGVAMCWELMRTQTARRLEGRVDVLIGGSAWWSVPHWRPRPVWSRLASRNAFNAGYAPTAMARMLGVPAVHASLCGPVRCEMPGLPFGYDGRYEGGAVICNGEGTELRRPAVNGDGVVIAEIAPAGERSSAALPSRFWLHRRGGVPALGWVAHGWHGRRHRRQHGGARVAISRTPQTAAPLVRDPVTDSA